MSALAGRDTISTFLAPHHAAVAEEAAGFARQLAARPVPHSDDEARVHAKAILRDAGRARQFAPILAGDLRACCLVREEWAAASPLADAVFALQALSTRGILTANAPELVERYVEPAVAGELMGGFAMTEPDAGSDVASIQTVARRDGDDYVITGRKTYISNAGIADFYMTFAKTDPDAGAKGVSVFVVPASEVNFLGPQVLSEPHPLGELEFDGARVPASHRLGEEGDGFRLGLGTLDGLRATVAAAACGMARRALDEALAHVRGREQFGQPLSEFQLVQQKLARMATELDASRLLTYRAAAAADAGAGRVTIETSMAKSYATEAAQRIVDDAVQLLAGRGVMAEHIVDRLYRAVRALRIYEGTTEIQSLVIARQLLRAAEAGA